MNRIILDKISNLERRNKIFIIAVFDFLLSVGSFVFAFILFERRIPDITISYDFGILIIVAAISVFAIALFHTLQLYKDIFRFVGFRSIGKLVLGIFVTCLVFYILAEFFLAYGPKRVILLYGMIYSISAISMRIFARILLKDSMRNRKNAERVLIYGSGESGTQVLQMMKNSAEYIAVGFIDDDKKKHGLKVDGLNIFPSVQAPLLIDKLAVDTILIAMPSARRSRRRNIIFGLEDCDVKIKTIPHIDKIMDGSHAITEIQNIDITELLGREPVKPKPALFSKCIENQTVMVTGGAGSIGSELCRQILKSNPKCLIIFDNSEYSLYAIEQEISAEIKDKKLDISLMAILGSVQSKPRLNDVFNRFKIDTIYHAAAYKHVPLVEQNVVEGITNNIFGTLNVAQAAIEHGVKYFTLVSTDKAVRPTNVMGASKRMAELVLQALANEPHGTCFSMVRFGNVLGSSGSVVPLFKKQIEVGGPVTVTDPDIIRFFMTIPEASQLVIQAGAMAKGGEVFVLDMGEPVKIYDLARQMINLAGLSVLDNTNPEGDIEISFTGLRPGEKLFEELLIGDNVIKTKHERILAAKEVCLTWQNYEHVLDRVKTACELYDIDSLHNIFNEMPVGYNHSGKYVDLIMKK